MPLYLVVGPAAEPISVADAKAHCRIDGTLEDTLIASLILAARLHIERGLDIALVSQRWRLELPMLPGAELRLPISPVAEIMQVIAGGIVQSPGNYTLSGDTLRFAVCLAGPVEITFTAGYGAPADVPEPLRLALRMLVAHWFEGREPAEAGSPRAVDALCAPYARARL